MSATHHDGASPLIPISNWKINEKKSGATTSHSRNFDSEEEGFSTRPPASSAVSHDYAALRDVIQDTARHSGDMPSDPLEAFISSTRRLQLAVQEANKRAAEMEKRWRDAASEREFISRQAETEKKRSVDEIQMRDSRIDDLSQRLGSATRMLDEAKGRLEKQYHSLSSYKERELLYSQAEATRKKLETESQEQAKKITDLESRAERLRREYEIERNQRKKYEDEAKRYRLQLEKAVDQVRAQWKTIDQLESGHKELSAKTSGERALIKEALGRQRSELNSAVERMAHSIDQFRSETTSTLEAGKRETDSRITEFGRQIGQATDRIDAFGRQLSDMHSTVQTIKNESRSLKYKLTVAENMRNEIEVSMDTKIRQAAASNLDTMRGIVRSEVSGTNDELQKSFEALKSMIEESRVRRETESEIKLTELQERAKK